MVTAIEDSARDALHAWAIAIVAHIEKQFSTLQSKYDYHPSKAGDILQSNTFGRSASTNKGVSNLPVATSSSGASIACVNVCKSLEAVITAVHLCAASLERINLVDLFWRPFGQQVMAVLLSHIRKSVISREGAAGLLRDIDEFCNVRKASFIRRLLVFLILIPCLQVLAGIESGEILDMLACLKEITAVFVVAPDEVTKVVVEHLRHLDTAVVLSLVKARSDYTPGGSLVTRSANSGSWSKQLEDVYPFFKGDICLPWEGRKSITILTFTESAKAGPGNQLLGPLTLRKASLLTLSAAVNVVGSPGGRGSSSPQRNKGTKDQIKRLADSPAVKLFRGN